MIKIYNTNMQTNKTEEVKEFIKGSWINMVHPSSDEINYVCSELKIQEDFIKKSLDDEEKPRIDIEEDDNTILFVIDVPMIAKENDNDTDTNHVYDTMPVGIIMVRDDFIITVSLKSNSLIKKFENKTIKNFATYMKSRFLFQIMLENSSFFLTYLRRINKETEIAESKLKNSLRNQELLKMLSLEKSLVYLKTSLRANETVMEKTLRGKFIKLYEDDDDILEDAIIENKQAIEMGEIYSGVLNGTMDAYASIISNNLNGVMKFLTSITIILAIPTMVSSFWGMNVGLPFQSSPNGFSIMLLISILITILVTVWLKKKDFLN